jgi:hypothetical protein
MTPEAASVLNALIQLLGKLLWPAVAIMFLISFKENIQHLIKRVGSISFPGTKLIFQKVSITAPAASAALLAETFEVGPDGFLTAKARKKVISGSDLEEQPVWRRELLIYTNPAQQTWMVATEKNIFVLLDDANTRFSSMIVQACFAKELVLPLAFGTDGPTTTVAFAIDVDDWWYYSDSIFFSPKQFEAAVKKLIK